MLWETKRKLLYGLTFFVMCSALLVFFMYDRLFPAPTCFDTKKNGYELGVDCGGTCALRCTQEVNPLTVVWAKAVTTGNGIYDLVALVTNTNIDNASREIGYTFTLYDEKGMVTGQLSGSTTAPLDGKFPLIIQNIPLQNSPVNVTATLTDGDHYTVRESPTSPTIKVLDRHYEGGEVPRVYATITNTKRIEITNLPVRVLLFDAKDNVYAVGQTVVPRIEKEGTKEIIITWNNSLPYPPTRIGLYPIFNPYEATGY